VIGVSLDSQKPYITKFASAGRYVVVATRNTRGGVYGVVI